VIKQIANGLNPMQRVIFILTIVSALAWSTSQAAELRLRRQCSPRGPVVTLGDVAEIYSAEAGQAAKLAAMELCPASPTGQQRLLRVREIQDILALRGVNLAEHQFSGSNQVMVTSSDAARADSRQDPTSSAAKRTSGRPQEAAVFSTVVTAVHSLSRDAVIREGDLTLVSQSLKEGEDGPFHTVDEVIGKQTTRAIPSGKIIVPDDLKAPEMIRKGDVVTVYARGAGIRVRTTARAKSDAGLGDQVTVETLHDRKPFQARVCGVREAEVLTVDAERGTNNEEIKTRKDEI
jgi:flagella basal body P-ring formation protein FlgA